jgi:hypothetical protein
MPQSEDWPDFFPEGIPPNDAKPSEGEAFRLVTAFPPSNSDFYPASKRSQIENLRMTRLE